MKPAPEKYLAKNDPIRRRNSSFSAGDEYVCVARAAVIPTCVTAASGEKANGIAKKLGQRLAQDMISKSNNL